MGLSLGPKVGFWRARTIFYSVSSNGGEIDKHNCVGARMSIRMFISRAGLDFRKRCLSCFYAAVSPSASLLLPLLASVLPLVPSILE